MVQRTVTIHVSVVSAIHLLVMMKMMWVILLLMMVFAIHTLQAHRAGVVAPVTLLVVILLLLLVSRINLLIGHCQAIAIITVSSSVAIR